MKNNIPLSHRQYLLQMIVAIMLLPFMANAQAAPKPEDGALLAVSNGKGELRFLWAPPVAVWPQGGWRLLDQDNTPLADITALNPDRMRDLDNQDTETVTSLIQGLGQASTQDELAHLRAMLGMQAMSSWSRALALGVAHVLQNMPKGPRAYSIVGLDGSGKATKTVLTSAPIDAHVATLPLPAPTGLHAEPHPQGAALFWASPVTPREIPVIAFVVERAENDRPAQRTESVILGVGWNSTEPAYIDELAQIGSQLTYTVRSIDAFGRQSPPAAISLFMDDTEAMLPPASLTATSEPGRITLAWTPGDNPNISGWAVERSTTENGLHEVLTPKALDPKTSSWFDNSVIDGVIYSYRIRAVSPAGTMGPPSGSVQSMPPNAANPPAPKGVTVSASPVLVTVNWERSDYPMAGYIVERKSGAGGQWNRLNPRVTPERTFKDTLTPGTHGTLHYRVTAVSLDNRRSLPSAEVMVSLEDTTPPPPPSVTDLEVKNGIVILRFAPGQPEEKSASFLVARGHQGTRQGEIVAADLPTDNRIFEDRNVEPGQAWWYMVTAVDQKGRQSEPSDKRLIVVESPEIPQPPAPRVNLQAIPFTHVRAEFPAPQPPLRASLQRQDTPDGPWRTVVRDITADWAMDANPLPDGLGQYRLVYHSPNGLEGDPSPPVALKR